MRYYIDQETLFLRGAFRAASTGSSGGIRDVTTVFLHQAGGDDPADPARQISLVAAAHGVSSQYFGLLVKGGRGRLCIFQYDFVTVFLAADIGNGKEGRITALVFSGGGLSDGALLGGILTAGRSMTAALVKMGIAEDKSLQGDVIVASEGQAVHEEGGPGTAVGDRIRACILHGIPESVKRSGGKAERRRPGLFVFSRFGGEHWVEWNPEGCPYYPCHFEGQRCDYCYCPFYPCREEDLGQWVESSGGGQVWNCSRCTLLHEPAVASYLKRNPEATLGELRVVRKKSTG
ncbi:MAG: hypothetical protein LUQ25_04500, partial [Methanoregulaceae archaeon]|nr:hypothetical protein [Methanoregulaceae archaeon]